MIIELRAALQRLAAYDAPPADAGRPTSTDLGLGAGAPVKAVHIAELRAAVVALE